MNVLQLKIGCFIGFGGRLNAIFIRISQMRLPLVLTFFRVIMSPLFVALYLFSDSWGISGTLLPYLLLFIVALCELTDIFDGFFARRRNQVTSLGKVLDPMADSFFRLSVFFSFTQGDVQLPLMIVLVFSGEIRL